MNTQSMGQWDSEHYYQDRAKVGVRNTINSEQLQIVMSVICGRGVLGVLPTAFGETFCFSLQRRNISCILAWVAWLTRCRNHTVQVNRLISFLHLESNHSLLKQYNMLRCAAHKVAPVWRPLRNLGHRIPSMILELCSSNSKCVTIATYIRGA